MPTYATLNTLSRRQNGRHFVDDIFKCIFFFISNIVKFVSSYAFDKKSILIRILDWHRTGDKPSSEPMISSFTDDICATRPPWISTQNAVRFTGSEMPRIIISLETWTKIKFDYIASAVPVDGLALLSTGTFTDTVIKKIKYRLLYAGPARGLTNTLRFGNIGWHFVNDTFGWIFFKEIFNIWIMI